MLNVSIFINHFKEWSFDFIDFLDHFPAPIDFLIVVKTYIAYISSLNFKCTVQYVYSQEHCYAIDF